MPTFTFAVWLPFSPGAVTETRLQPRADPLRATRRPFTSLIFSETFDAAGGGAGVGVGVMTGGLGVGVGSGDMGVDVGTDVLGLVTDMVLLAVPPHLVATLTVYVTVSPSASCTTEVPLAATGHGGATASEQESCWVVGAPPTRLTVVVAMPLCGSAPAQVKLARPAASRSSDATSADPMGRSR